MYQRSPRRLGKLALLCTGVLAAALLTPVDAAQAAPAIMDSHPTVSGPAAFDTSKPLRELAPPSASKAAVTAQEPEEEDDDFLEERLPEAVDHGFSGDSVVQNTAGTPSTGGTRANFEGISNNDNFTVLGRRVNPPDPN